ncbi:hypothetical protein P6F34_gp19 [Pseudomonas phage MiCath]|uniref:Uncharacterized protein n=1 Tax=Pseudomonas phage MiCath TaxID=3003729 RepID=A0AAE9VE91_9CAUD|nr:hypothetical protein P6F34_gp19 [Pseudomonas phage MiCath]WAX22372.1 hypothetical protein [Pseudomonas phage MiCath]
MNPNHVRITESRILYRSIPVQIVAFEPETATAPEIVRGTVKFE